MVFSNHYNIRMHYDKIVNNIEDCLNDFLNLNTYLFYYIKIYFFHYSFF
jgi:hypothetical protein